MKWNYRWFTSTAVLLLFWAISWVLIIIYSLLSERLFKVNNFTDKTRAINNSIIWIEDAKSLFYNNRFLFYDYNKMSPCDTIWSIANYANYSTNSFKLSDTLNFKDNSIWKENLKDDQWFLNRYCSLYTKWIPNYYTASYSIKWDSSDLWTKYKWQNDEKGFFNIKKILDNKWFGYFFTSDQIWEEEISLKLDYNFPQFKWIDSLNIYNEDLYNKILLLKKNDSWLEVTKSNLKSVLTESMYIYDDANLEIWIVEFDWIFDPIEGFHIDKNSWKIIESIHEVWEITKWLKKGRLLCDGTSETCSLDSIKLKNNKIYFGLFLILHRHNI